MPCATVVEFLICARLLPGGEIEDLEHAPLLEGGEEQLPVRSHGNIVGPPPGLDPPADRPAGAVHLDDFIGLVAGDEDLLPVDRGLRPGRRAGVGRHRVPDAGSVAHVGRIDRWRARRVHALRRRHRAAIVRGEGALLAFGQGKPSRHLEGAGVDLHQLIVHHATGVLKSPEGSIRLPCGITQVIMRPFRSRSAYRPPTSRRAPCRHGD